MLSHWAVIFIPIPLPDKVQQTSSCTMLLYRLVLQTVLGMGMGMNVTAHTHTHQLHTCICISMPPSQSAFQSSCTCFVAILSTIYVETKHNTSMSIRLHMWLFCFVSSELLKGRLLELLLEHPIRSVYLPKHPCLLARTSRSLGPV